MIWSGTNRERYSSSGLAIGLIGGVLALFIGLITPVNAQDDVFGPDLGPVEETPDGGLPPEAPDAEPLPPESPGVGVAPAPAPEPAAEGATPPESVAVDAMPAAPATAVAAPAAGEEVETMVVTAQFREQNPQETPLAITAVDSKTLEERSQTRIDEVAAQAPNVRLSEAPGTYGPSLQAHIRGVGQFDFNFALEPGVGIYVDDVYYSTLTGSVIDLLDLERVEILRGPQGTLSGQNSIGGAIKLYSKPPTGEGGGYIQTTYGRYNRTELQGGADFTIVEDKLFARISGVGKHKDGYVTRYDFRCTHPNSAVPSYQTSDSCKLGTEGGKAIAATRGALRFLPIKEVEVNLIGDYTNDNSEATPNTLLYVGSMTGPGVAPDATTGLIADNRQINGVPLGTAAGSEFVSYSPYGSNWALDPYSDSPYINYSTYINPNPITPLIMGPTGPEPAADTPVVFSFPPDFGVDSYGTSGKLDIDFTDYVSLTSITAYRGYDGGWSVDEGTPIGVYMIRNLVKHDQISEELRLNFALFEKVLNLTFGGFILDKDSHYGARPQPATLQFVEDSDITAHTYAGFGNADWEVIKGLNLVAGGRYTYQDKTFIYGRTNIAGIVTPFQVAGLDGVKGEFDGDHADFRGAVQYRWIPELMTYAQVASGFKGGGVNPRPFYEVQATDPQAKHDPETLIGYEIGAKSDWFEKRLRVNVSGFFNQYNDILMSVSNCPMADPITGNTTPCMLPLNAGEAHVFGGEVETSIYPVRELGIDASFSYLYFKYQSITEAGLTSGITKDMEAPYAPELQASGGIKYDFLFGSAGTFTPRLDLSYQSSFYTNPDNSEFSLIDDRLLLNGRLTWTSFDDTWMAAFEMTNITNLVYYYSVRDDRASSGTVQGNPAPPLEWAVTLRRNFDI